MKKQEVFWWALGFACSAVFGIILLPSPAYAFCASSIVHAFMIMFTVENTVFAWAVVIYSLFLALALPACCILTYKGNPKPTIVVMLVDLLVSLSYLLFMGFTNDNLPLYFKFEIAGFFVRILYLLIGIACIKSSHTAVDVINFRPSELTPKES